MDQTADVNHHKASMRPHRTLLRRLVKQYNPGYNAILKTVRLE